MRLRHSIQTLSGRQRRPEGGGDPRPPWRGNPALFRRTRKIDSICFASQSTWSAPRTEQISSSDNAKLLKSRISVSSPLWTSRQDDRSLAAVLFGTRAKPSDLSARRSSQALTTSGKAWDPAAKLATNMEVILNGISHYGAHRLCKRALYSCRRAVRTRVTFGQVLPCRKAHLATYRKARKLISLRADDIGRALLLTQPLPGRQLPVVSA